MFTAIYALDHVIGAEIWLAGCIVCLLVAVMIGFAIKTNRGMPGTLYTAAGIMVPAVLCDIAWFLIYFPGGEYRNMGIGAAGGLFLYPFCLAVGVMISSYMNKERE